MYIEIVCCHMSYNKKCKYAAHLINKLLFYGNANYLFIYTQERIHISLGNLILITLSIIDIDDNLKCRAIEVIHGKVPFGCSTVSLCIHSYLMAISIILKWVISVSLSACTLLNKQY